MKINEGFADALDSSLIDYSSEFEKNDKIYKIKNWLNTNLMFSHLEHDIFNNDANLDWDEHGEYQINDDYSITLYADIVCDKSFDTLPDYINFREAKGNIKIKNPFISFRGFPPVIWGYLHAEEYAGTSLEYMPKAILGVSAGGNGSTTRTLMLNVQNCNSLEGMPIICGGTFLMGRNITSDDINYVPKYLGGTYSFDDRYSTKNWFSGLSYNDMKSLDAKIKKANKDYYDAFFTHGKNVDNEILKIVKDENITYNGFTDYKRLDPFKHLRAVNKVDEGFADALDSSLIDYSSEFERQDKETLKKRIKIWLYLFTAFDRRSFVINEYTINDDLTIDLHTNFMLFNNAHSCFQYKFKSYLRYWSTIIADDDPDVLDFLYNVIHTYSSDISIDELKNMPDRELSEIIKHVGNYISYYNMDYKRTSVTTSDKNYMIPSWIHFNSCDGDFIAKPSTGLISLKGLPKRINGNLCIDNLKSLTTFNNDIFEDGPEYVGKSLYATGIGLTNNDFKKFPIVNDNIILNRNSLTSLNGLPTIINGSLYINDNKLPNLKGTVKYVKKSIDATGQRPDYQELVKEFITNNPDSNIKFNDDVLNKMMGPRGIRYFGEELRFGYKPETDGFWFFNTKISDNECIPILKRGPENSAMLQGIKWWDPIHKIGKPMKWIKD